MIRRYARSQLERGGGTRKVLAFLSILGDLVIVVAITVVSSFLHNTWSRYPMGSDSVVHVYQVEYIIKNFPHIDWWYQWAAGIPLFLYYFYPPFLLMALFARATGTSAFFALQATAILSFCVVGIALYGLVYGVSGSRRAALIAPLIFFSSSGIYIMISTTGEFHRVIAFAFLALFLWALVRYIKHPTKGSYLTTVFSLILALSGYILMGLMSLMNLFILLLAAPWSFRERLSRMLKVSLPALLASLLFYGPSIRNILHTRVFASPRFIGGTGAILPPLKSFLLPHYAGFLGLSVSMIPLLLLGLAVAARSGALRVDKVATRLIMGLGGIAISLAIYGGAGHFGYPTNMYYTNFPPTEALNYIPLYLAPVCAILIGLVLNREHEKRKQRHNVLFLLAGLIALAAYYPLLPLMQGEITQREPVDHPILHQLLDPESGEFNYRFGTDWGGVAAEFNNRFEVPQTRDWFDQGILIPDWRYWLEVEVWEKKGNYDQTNFLLDWFAVKWFTVGAPHFNFQKFQERPDLYRYVGYSLDDAFHTGKIYGFVYNHATPILSASNALSALVIGSSGYDVVFRDFAYVDCDSGCVIPLRGHAYVDDHALAELSQFDVVLLYNFELHDQAKAFTLLGDYVRNGGGLIIETNNSPDTAAFSLPDPVPVTSTKATDYGTDWSLSSVEHEMVKGIDLSSFGPAIYAGGPWGVSSVAEESIRDWASPVLRANGHPIVVAGQYGQGRVVWTGMNLLYHIASHQNEEESRFLARMIQWVSNEDEVVRPQYEARFVHPQRREVTVQSRAKGVLFKESYFPNWHAYVAGQEGRIYRAGPDFMYVPIPQGTSYPVQVIFEYRKSSLEQAAAAISFVTLAALLLYLWKGWMLPPTWRRAGARALRRSTTFLAPLREWWEKEEV